MDSKNLRIAKAMGLIVTVDVTEENLVAYFKGFNLYMMDETIDNLSSIKSFRDENLDFLSRLCSVRTNKILNIN
jgi:hypothetical protein